MKNELKRFLERQLTANMLKEQCAADASLLFREAWCTQERTVRFTTPFLRSLFPEAPEEKGGPVRYELNTDPEDARIACVLEGVSFHGKGKETAEKLKRLPGAKTGDGITVLRAWDITPADGKADSLSKAFDAFLHTLLLQFETDCRKELTDPEEYREGELKHVRLNKYERNRKAREACIAARGTACAVCGIDFGKVYGKAFAGKTEVHHIVPLSEIGKDYSVDPIRDLVPVCPNCHTALHSKPNGVYTVEELKKIMKEENSP